MVIKGKNIPFTQGRQALHKGYMHPFNWHTLAAPDWLVFIQRVQLRLQERLHRGRIEGIDVGRAVVPVARLLCLPGEAPSRGAG